MAEVIVNLMIISVLAGAGVKRTDDVSSISKEDNALIVALK